MLWVESPMALVPAPWVILCTYNYTIHISYLPAILPSQVGKEHHWMDTIRIIADLRSHRDRLDQAITALEALNGISTPGTAVAAPVIKSAKPGSRISPEGMARIIAATKARWARVRAAKSAGTTAKRAPLAMKKTAAGGHTMSPAARKRISEAAKKRWAARKKQGKNRL